MLFMIVNNWFLLKMGICNYGKPKKIFYFYIPFLNCCYYVLISSKEKVKNVFEGVHKTLYEYFLNDG